MSYGQLAAYLEGASAWCHDELQVAEGDVVGILPAHDLDSVVWLFALLQAGCSVLVLNHTEPAVRTRAQASSLNVKRILRGPQIARDYMPEALLAPDPRILKPSRPEQDSAQIRPGAPALFFATSGSTAVSKLVAQSHYNAAVNAHAVCLHHRLVPGDRLLGCLPFYHVNGVHFTLFATVVAGAHAVVLDEFDPFTYRQAIDRVRPRIASLVPSLLESLLDAHDCRPLPGDFGYFVSAAAPLTTSTVRAVWRTMTARIVQGYGLTETTNFSTTLPIDLSDRAYQRLMCDADIPSVGVALYGNDVAIIQERGNRAPLGQVGEVCIRGHNVMLGYEANPVATADAFRDGWFHTQDLGLKVVEPETGRELVVLTGRLKHIAKVGGEAVSLDEMERMMRTITGVSDAGCVSVPHRLLGDEILAAVVSSVGLNAEAIKGHLRRWFSSATLPRTIVQIPAIPRTATGKIRRTELAHEIITHRQSRTRLPAQQH